jgi:hypothetical protein
MDNRQETGCYKFIVCIGGILTIIVLCSLGLFAIVKLEEIGVKLIYVIVTLTGAPLAFGIYRIYKSLVANEPPIRTVKEAPRESTIKGELLHPALEIPFFIMGCIGMLTVLWLIIR